MAAHSRPCLSRTSTLFIAIVTLVFITHNPVHSGELISNLATPVYDTASCTAQGANCKQRIAHTVTMRFTESDTQTTLALLGVPGTDTQSIIHTVLAQPVTIVYAMGPPAGFIPLRSVLMVTQICAAPNTANATQFQIGLPPSQGRRLLGLSIGLGPLGTLGSKHSTPTFISTALSLIPFGCTFFSCDDGGTSQEQLDAVLSSLDTFTMTQAQWNSNQSQWNNVVAQQLVRNTATFTAVQAQLDQQRLQTIALVNQTTMLATSIRLLNEQTDLRFALDQAEVDALQMQTSALATATSKINTATQTQIKTLQEQIRNLVRRMRNLIGTMIDVTTLKPRRKRILAATYSILQALDPELEAFFSISNLQPPDYSVLTQMQIIDTYNTYFTYQESPTSSYYAVQLADTLLCNVTFILSTNQAQSSWMDLLEKIGYPHCLVNDTCQCYITVTASVAFIGFPGVPQPFLVAPYPYAFIDNPSLQCGGTLSRCLNPNTGVTSPINIYQDPLNQDPTAPYSVSLGVGSYTVADTNEAAAQDTATILAQNPSTFNALLRKRCNQMFSGQIVNGFQIPGQVNHDFSVPGIFNYGFNQKDPNSGTFITNNQFPVLRFSSNLLYTYQDLGAPSDISLCAFNGDSLSFQTQVDSGLQTYYSAYLITMMNSFNTYVNIEYQNLQAQAYGQVIPDLVCEFSMFQQNGNLDSYGCDNCYWLAVSHPSEYLPVHMLSQVAQIAEVQTSITDLNGNPLQPTFNTTDVTIVTDFPMPTSMLLIGSTVWSAPGSVVFDFPPAALSIDSNAEARAGTMGYLVQPASSYELYKTGLVPPLEIWVENFGSVFSPRSGQVQALDYRQELSPFSIGRPQVCTGGFQAVGGICIILQNWRFVCNEEDADFVSFVNYGGFDVIVTTQIPEGEIALIQTSFCPQDFTTVIPSSTMNYGGLMIINPTNVDNVVLMTVASANPPDGCGTQFNVQVTIPANGTQFLFFPACGHQVVTFALTDGFNTQCPGFWTFDLNLPGPFTPGSLPINVNVTLQLTEDTVASSLLDQSNSLMLLQLQMYSIALLGPSADTLATVASIINSTYIANLRAAANVSSNVFSNQVTQPLIDAVLNLSTVIDQSLQTEAAAAAIVYDLQNQSNAANQAIIAQTNVIANITTQQNANALDLHNQIQKYLDHSDSTGSSCGYFDLSDIGCIFSTIWHVFIIILFCGVGYLLYKFYQKAKAEKDKNDAENREKEIEEKRQKHEEQREKREERQDEEEERKLEKARKHEREVDEKRAAEEKRVEDAENAAAAKAKNPVRPGARTSSSSSTTNTTTTNNNNNNGVARLAGHAEGGGRGTAANGETDDIVLRLRAMNGQSNDDFEPEGEIVEEGEEGVAYLMLK